METEVYKPMGTEEHWSDDMDAKAASIRLAFAALRYALGGKAALSRIDFPRRSILLCGK